MKRLAQRIIILTFMVNFFVQANGIHNSNALSGSSFTANKIIPDSVFFNSNSLSATDIQNFLAAKVPICDTNGTQMHGIMTRAQYGASQGYPAPYTCLKDFRQDTNAKTVEAGLCNGYAASNQSSAEIIYTVAQSCGINPKVLIVLLQKEQALVTDDWPWSIQYRSATGYGCPDTAPCDAAYYGFFNQVYNAARQYKKYARDASLFNYQAGRNSYVQYNPNNGCGGTSFSIMNQATAGLYNYTPYQPNQAALDNLYGTGDSCSAYGNRNFWRLFNDYFGSSEMEVPYAWALESQDIYSDAQRTKTFTSIPTVAPGDKIYLTIKARNIGNETWTPTTLKLGSNNPNDRTSPFYDASWLSTARPASALESSVTPGQTGTFNVVLTAPAAPGTYKENYNLVADGITWLNNLGLYYVVNVVKPVAPQNTTNLSLSGGEALPPGKYLLSPDTNSSLAVQGDGNTVIYNNFKPVWSTRTAGSSVSKLIMQTDGNLVLYGQNGVATWESRTSGNPGSRLTTQTDGNMVIYSATNAPLWNSSTTHNPDLLDYVNTTIGNAAMLPLQRLETQDRAYKLILQDDGNLVLYTNAGKALWNSRTQGKNAVYSVMQGDGNLVLYTIQGKAVWSSNSMTKRLTRLIIQGDGNLVIYDSSNIALWASGTNQ